MIYDLQRQLGIDASFFKQLVIFLVIFTWMQAVYFRPFLKLIQRRASQSGGLSSAAVGLEQEALRAEAEYGASMSAARKKAAVERERLLLEAREQANEIVGVARAQAKTKLDQARESNLHASELELSAMRTHVGEVSAMLVEKLTKTKVGI